MPAVRTLLRKPAVLFAGLILLLLIAGGLAVVFLDGPPVDDSEMAVGLTNIPDEENGYVILAELEDEFETSAHGDLELLEAELAGGIWKADPVREFIRRHAVFYVRWDRAAAAGAFQAPAETDLLGPDMGFPFRGPSRLRGELFRREGQPEQAWLSIRAQLRVAAGLATARGGASAVLSARVLELGAWEDVRVLAGASVCPPGLLDEILGFLQGEGRRHLGAGAESEAAAIALKRRYLGICNLVDGYAAGEVAVDALWGAPKFLPRCLAKPNLTRAELLPVVMEMLATAPDFKGMIFRGLEPDGWYYFSPNYSGRHLMNAFYPDIFLLRALYFREARTAHGATLLHLALHRYRRRHGQFPERLEHLVPDFLPELPADPFDSDGSGGITGAPLRYDRAKARVWSVGEDGFDDGGGEGSPLPFYDRNYGDAAEEDVAFPLRGPPTGPER